MSNSHQAFINAIEKASQRDADLKALKSTKELERKLAGKLQSVRIDNVTVVTATPKRLKELIKAHTARSCNIK